MFRHETFPNAPITEALIDLRVTFGQDVTPEQLDDLSERFLRRFPKKEPQTEIEHQLMFHQGGSGTETHVKAKRLGYVLFSQERDKAVQLRVNGFSFSKLKPYEDWDSLRDETLEHWEMYRSAMGPSRIVRLAVRYINRIEIPLPVSDFRDYILTGLQIADGVPQGLEEFFFRAVIPNPDDPKMKAAVNSTFEDLENEALPYIFDIDAFTPVDLDPADKVVWSTLESLRDYKNLIFFMSMSERAKELFR